MSPSAGAGEQHSSQGFRFAQRYAPQRLLVDPAERRRFLEEVLLWEGQFLRPGVGIASSGLTVDGAHIEAGERLRSRSHSNPSKEALHLLLLGLAVGREGAPRLLLPLEVALEQLERKAAALEAYRAANPGHHGFMPWFDAEAGGAALEPQLAMRYNGMLAWALYLAVHALREAGHAELAARLGAHLDEMRSWAVRLAYKGEGRIAARVTPQPRQEAAWRSEQNCDDPFAGELFCLFLDLLADWGEQPPGERDRVWADGDRRGWLCTGVLELEAREAQPAQQLEASLHGTFSAHEEWKYLFLPYQALPVGRRLLLSAERVRTAYARSHGLPGLLGDCHVPEDWFGDGCGQTRHVTAFGVPGVSSLRAEEARRDAVAASGALGALLAEQAVGAAWLHATLAACGGMQTPWGMAESCRADGAAACPLLTWDGKATTALAVLGGAGGAMQRYLRRDGLFQRFADVVQGAYGHLAEQPFAGETADLALPPGVSLAWRSAEEDAVGVDVELVKACRGVTLPAGDARKLCEVRRWFEAHQTDDGDALYCIPSGFEDWCVVEGGRYAMDDVGRERLYTHIVATFELGVPLVLLARQAPTYALFFDLDMYGGAEEEEAAGSIYEVAWDGEDRVLLRSIALAVLQLYPQLCSGLEVAVFCSSGICQSNGRHKASYHLVFPQVAVDRPVKAWPDGPEGDQPAVPGRHLLVRDHVVCFLSEEAAAGGSLARLREQLLECCSEQVSGEGAGGPESEEEEEEEPTCLNDWTEILDDKPLRHEPWPEAATGLRLPFTDKAAGGGPEGRPKLPLGRWRLRAEAGLPQDPEELLLERLPDLEPVEWVRLGDIAAGGRQDLTPWDVAAAHPAAAEASPELL